MSMLSINQSLEEINMEDKKTIYPVEDDISMAIKLLDSIQKCQAEQVDRVRLLLENEIIKKDHIESRIRRQLTGERYNIFDVLGVGYYENMHSSFLRHLLDPKESHDQGLVFLNSFIKILVELADAQGIKIEKNCSPDWSKAIVKNEVSHENGRFDVAIEVPNKAYIIIENKVKASEQEDQLARYGAELKKKTHEYKSLIFLTPTGYESKTKGSYSVVNMSYDHLAKFLKDATSLVKPTATPVIATVLQYIEQCNHIHKGENFMTYMNEEIINLLKNPNNFEVAYNIATHFSELKKWAKNKFKTNVVSMLSEMLKNAGSAWYATDYAYWGAGCISLEFSPDNLKVFYGNIFHKDPGTHQFGWYDPNNKINHNDNEIISIVNEMNENYPVGKNNWWLCCIEGASPRVQMIPTLDMSEDNNDDMKKIIADNENVNHPMAKDVADAMFTLFVNYRDEVEKLALFQKRLKT